MPPIEATPHLTMSEPLSPPLDRDSILAHLGPDAGLIDLALLQTCASTNDLLIAQRTPAHRMAVLSSEQQTAGRGRRGRSWQSWPGGSLLFSVRWERAARAPTAGLSLAAGVAIAQALESFGTQGLQLKWPNDLLLRGRKAGGILVEMTQAGAAQAVVIGVGLNLIVPEPPPDEMDIAGVFAAMPSAPTREALFARLIQRLLLMRARFDDHGFAAFADEWSARNAHAGAMVCLSGEREAHVGRFAGVDLEGALLLETPAGLARVLSGDLSLRERT